MWEILQEIAGKVTLINLMIFILVMVEIVSILKDYYSDLMFLKE